MEVQSSARFSEPTNQRRLASNASGVVAASLQRQSSAILPKLGLRRPSPFGKLLPLDLRPKKTRVICRRLSKHQDCVAKQRRILFDSEGKKMNKDWLTNRDKLSHEYAVGVKEFLEMAKRHVDHLGQARCPCKKCMNGSWKNIEGIRRHLFIHGMSASYSHWVYHGELVDLSRLERQRLRSMDIRPIQVDRMNVDESTDHNNENEIMKMLND